MAEAVEIELKATGADEVKRELDKVSGSLEDTGKATEETTGSMSQFAAGLGGATVVVKEVIAVVGNLLSGLKELGDEFDRQASVMNRFTGDVSAAQERTDGLISEIDLMIAQQKILQSGLNLTADEFANVVVASIETAASVGEANNNLNQFAASIARGSAGRLQLGIDLEGITSVADKQRAVLDALSDRYGNQTSEADTLASEFGKLSIAIDDATTEFFEGVNAADGMLQSFEELQTATAELAAALGIALPDGLEVFVQAGIIAGAVVQTMVDKMTALVNAARQLAAGDLVNAALSLQEFTELVPVARVRANIREAQARLAEQRATRGAKEAQGLVEGVILPPAIEGKGAKTAGARAAAGRGDGARGQEAARGRKAEEREALRETEAEKLRRAILQAEAEERQQRGRISGELETSEELTERLQRLAEDAKETADRAARGFGDLRDGIRDAVDEANKISLMPFINQVQSLTNAIGALTFDVIANGPKEALKAFAESYAKQEVLFALRDTALGVGFLITNPPAATSKFTSAALHAAAAVAAGAPAVALAAGGSGRGGPARPEAPGGGFDGGGGGGTVVINFNAPTDEATIGRQTRRALRASDRRDGNVL